MTDHTSLLQDIQYLERAADSVLKNGINEPAIIDFLIHAAARILVQSRGWGIPDPQIMLVTEILETLSKQLGDIRGRISNLPNVEKEERQPISFSVESNLYWEFLTATTRKYSPQELQQINEMRSAYQETQAASKRRLAHRNPLPLSRT